jgi:hypothetical protein
MTSKNKIEPQTKRPRGRPPALDTEFVLPNGDKLIPRRKFADQLGISERTARRMNLNEVYIRNTPYLKQNECMQAIADSAKPRNVPAKSKRRA